MSFVNALNHNRDENSFTSRLFENHLFNIWDQNSSCIRQFLQVIQNASQANYNGLLSKYGVSCIKPWTQNISAFNYKKGLLFVETRDIHGYIVENKLNQQNQNNAVPDRMLEFDCFIVCVDSLDREHLIVFEVKSYTNVEEDEIVAQHRWLQYFKNAGLFYEFHHFLLLNEVDIKSNRKEMWKTAQPFSQISNDLHVATWTDIRQFIPANRIANLLLPRTVKNTGVYEGTRFTLY